MQSFEELEDLISQGDPSVVDETLYDLTHAEEGNACGNAGSKLPDVTMFRLGKAANKNTDLSIDKRE